ncbi:hypothetical protein LNQ49_22980 [Flavobacterium sp. F-65]|uniref:Uncharacterized protein n=1 Tax=Flavobacterium pisciphilum TaxID=2893755 RepID=A0ABS8N0N0_9FLAO|nr:hypothetical protein [Flavobacterium sp. F-65]MCC9074458.1 hypothetical protein [Flavobacterium sp. F-65]
MNNKLVLFNDGDNDIIFTGTNLYANRLLCCIMFEDDEIGFLRYLHVLTTEEQYSEFINKKISFRNILDINQSAFLVDVDYNMIEIDSNIVSIDEIPSDFLPLSNSFCPEFIFEPSFTYSLSMVGGLADTHKTKAHELSNVSTHFSDFLKSSTTFLNDLDFENNIYVEALEAGSFKINFKIEYTEPQQIALLNVSKENINDFINDYFKYFFNQLPEENNNIFKNEIVNSEKFKELENKLEKIYEEKSVLPKGGVEQKLIDLINYSSKELEKIEYHGSFDRLKFQNITNTGQEIPFGIIDNDFILSVKDKMFDLSNFETKPIIVFDESPQKYKIQIYLFSIESGKGNAYYMDENGVISKIIIHATGKSNYDNTIFTRGMDDGKSFEITGIAKKVDGKIKQITCEL